MIPNHYRALIEGRASPEAAEASIRFLCELWDYDAKAYTFIGTRQGERWRDHPINGDRKAQSAAILAAYPSDRFDIYFCPNAFSQPRRKAAYALPSAYAWCDIDDADPDGYNPKPNILWQTSPGRYQGIWIWRNAVEGHIAESYSRNIWAKDGGDKGGWSITKMLRLPGSINHKPAYERPIVTLQTYKLKPQKLPTSISLIERRRQTEHSQQYGTHRGDASTIMRRYRRQVGLQAGILMTANRVMRADRSGAVYQIVAALISAGASDDEIVAVLLVNAYFTSKWGDDARTAKEQTVRIRIRVEAGQ